MSAHTPGPWSLDIGTGTIWAGRGTSFDCENELVERVATMRPTCVTDRWEADARLIAAAPDLLAALKGLAQEIETDGGIDTSDWPILDAAQAAIAKAEGR